MVAPTKRMPLPEEVRRQAISLLMDLRTDTPSEEAFQRVADWRKQHPDHERAWQHIEAFTGKMQGVSAPLAHATLAQHAPGLHRRQVVKALAVLLSAGGAAWVTTEQQPWRTWSADRHTGFGERASVTLDDGTLVELNFNTAISIHYSQAVRLIRLIEGEILVTTAHDPLTSLGMKPRPFLVQTDQGRVRALGTRFLVRELPENATSASRIAVFEGAVEAHPVNASAPTGVIHAGEQAHFTRDSLSERFPADEAATAWNQGMIVAHNMPLSDFLDEMGRYRRGRISCDLEVAHLKVTGTYPLADTDLILDVLSSTLPVRIQTATRYWVRVKLR